jgi:hypothetical protein
MREVNEKCRGLEIGALELIPLRAKLYGTHIRRSASAFGIADGLAHRDDSSGLAPMSRPPEGNAWLESAHGRG